MTWCYPERFLGRYVNPHIQDIKRHLWDLFLWRFGYYAEKNKRAPPPADFQYPSVTMPYDRNRPSAIWLGHSTYLIQASGLTFLTDPVFSSYCSPIPFQILKRRHDPPIHIHELPPIDVVLISHNHYDHLDEKSVCELYRHYPKILWIVPQGVKRWFMHRGITSVLELKWGQSSSVHERCQITAVPAQHFSGRSFWDQNRTLWCGYVVECPGKTFYFVGDTGYNLFDFKEIGRKWPAIDLSLIPIGTYVPQKFMQPVHISPIDAVNIHCDVKSRLSLGMHWKTFCLSEEPGDLPPYDLFLAMNERNLPFQSFLPIDPGLYVNW
jgi:N-acyl-phosphatidylethanolamine-hydrolysing phospholipase D